MKIEIPDHLIKEIIKNELKFIFNVEEDDMVKFGLETYDSYVEKVFNDPEFMNDLMFRVELSMPDNIGNHCMPLWLHEIAANIDRIMLMDDSNVL